MQCTLLRDCEGPNPAYDPRRPITDDNSAHRTIPAGTVIEHPDCWRLCLPTVRRVDPETHQIVEHDPPQAEPSDDACRARVASVLQQRTAVHQSRLQQREQQLLDTTRASRREKLKGN